MCNVPPHMNMLSLSKLDVCIRHMLMFYRDAQAPASLAGSIKSSGRSTFI